MARRLIVALILFSGLAFGQALSGRWSAKVSLLPPPVALSSMELALRGKLLDWTVGGTAEFFGTDGWVWQTVTAEGPIGPVRAAWTVLFGPLAPSFLYAYGRYGLLLSGVDLTLHTALVGPNGPYTFTGGPSGGAVLEAQTALNGLKVSLELGIGARKQDFAIVYAGVGTYQKVFPIDPFPGGLTFHYLKLGAEAVPLCCGVSLDLGFAFTKAGFDSLTATVKSVPICCGISFDAEVKFTPTAKAVSLKPKWAGIEGCFTVYGDAKFVGSSWQGIEVYGFKIRCALADCTYAELLTALNVTKVEEILEQDIFQGAEFEYLKLGFCGAGCCGGKWSLGVSLYFRPTGALFGLSRVLLDARIPVLTGLTADLGLSAVVGGPAGLTLGWTFTF